MLGKKETLIFWKKFPGLMTDEKKSILFFRKQALLLVIVNALKSYKCHIVPEQKLVLLLWQGAVRRYSSK